MTKSSGPKPFIYPYSFAKYLLDFFHPNLHGPINRIILCNNRPQNPCSTSTFFTDAPGTTLDEAIALGYAQNEPDLVIDYALLLTEKGFQPLRILFGETTRLKRNPPPTSDANWLNGKKIPSSKTHVCLSSGQGTAPVKCYGITFFDILIARAPRQAEPHAHEGMIIWKDREELSRPEPTIINSSGLARAPR